ncbi:MAG TPA: PDR/VanB family oxidoreductase, partial [Ramlibacter sp.]|nr:PDR/VanB family oxidoreductase [Ramlibacter sp.]
MQTLQAFVHTLRWEAQDTITVELRPVDASEFPAFTPGAHIDLHLPNGLERSYSLSNSADERHRYVVGVLKDRASRGGSRCVHEQLRVGMQIPISPPRNNFPLQEAAGHTVLVAGGIGITPLLCMARRLRDIGRSFELLYFARSRRSAAFLDVLQALEVPMTLHFDDEQGGPPDLKRMLAERKPAPDLHLYACGPTPMLDAFEKFCAELQLENAHVERFAAVEHKPSDDARSTFTVELARSKKTVTITPEKSILDTLLAEGIAVDHSCCEGVCGSCETRVLAGVPDHRDSILSAKERAANKSMMIC